MIKAIHPATGRKGEFSNEAWELLPEGKDGWQIEIPEEVADTILGNENSGTDPVVIPDPVVLDPVVIPEPVTLPMEITLTDAKPAEADQAEAQPQLKNESKGKKNG